MAEYRLKSGKHTRKENGQRVTYRAGDTIKDPSEREIKMNGDRLEKVGTEKAHEKPEKADSGDAKGEPGDEYPKHKGGTKWELSDGSAFNGKKAEAVAAEQGLRDGA